MVNDMNIYLNGQTCRVTLEAWFQKTNVSIPENQANVTDFIASSAKRKKNRQHIKPNRNLS